MSSENQKTILIVDDEAIIAMTAKMTLEKYGYKVVTANTGEEAVAAFEKTPAMDLILMDINLGAGIDGTEAAAIILRQRELPVVFLSSHIEPEIVARTEKITSYGYVVKNSGDTVLQASIKMAFKLFEAKKKEKEKESQREAAFEALRKSEALYQALIETSPDAIALSDQNGIIIMANQQLAELHGYESKEELIGRSAFELFAPEERRRAADNLGGAIGAGHGGIGKYEYILHKKDGSRFWGELYGKLMQSPDGKLPLMLTIIRDITERKRIEEELNIKDRALASSINAVAITDVNGVVRYVNDALLRMWGYTDREAYGMNVVDLASSRDEALRIVREIKEKGFCLGESVARRKDGSLLDVQLSASLVTSSSGAPIAMFSTFVDITERRRAEKALKEN